MSQIMATKPKNALIHDIASSNRKFTIISSANMARCDVCGKGLESGFSVTAKAIQNKTMFFCKTHLY